MRRIARLEETTPMASTPSYKKKARRQQQALQSQQRSSKASMDNNNSSNNNSMGLGQDHTSTVQQTSTSPQKDRTPRLSPKDQAELLRAARRGYVALDGTGFRRGRKTSALACAHRQLCDEKNHPQIVLCKASGGRPLDCLIVDLSPLRWTTTTSTDEAVWEDTKAQILHAAEQAGMELRTDYEEDNCHTLATTSTSSSDATSMVLVEKDQHDNDTLWEHTTALSILTDTVAWNTLPISKLPSLSLGVFEGERKSAKAMARALANLWETPHEPLDEDHKKKKGGSYTNKRQRKDSQRRRRRNERRDLNMYLR